MGKLDSPSLVPYSPEVGIWAAKAQSYGSLLGARIVGGFAASAFEALGSAVVCQGTESPIC